MKLRRKDYLHVVSFLLTIVMTIMALREGMSNLNLFLNISYFTTLNATFLIYLGEKFKDKFED